jgi:tungstate transport system substrate-binding protein
MRLLSLRLSIGLIALLLLACAPAASAPGQPATPRPASDVVLATTTSTQDSGLLDALVPLFEQQSGYRVKTISVGTGAALALGARGEADVVLVHAPQAEIEWMAQGNGTERRPVMHNDFVVVGPAADPAKVGEASDTLEAFKRIADSQISFVSRGDSSGTHQVELELWRQTGLEPKGAPWYVESGIAMGQTLTVADQKDAYTISDRATWLARKSQVRLSLLFEGDPPLFNRYHVMPVNPSKFPNLPINAPGAKAFADFLVAPDTQQVIASFGKEKYGEPLFFPDAKRE